MDLDSPWSDFYDLLLQDEASHSETEDEWTSVQQTSRGQIECQSMSTTMDESPLNAEFQAFMNNVLSTVNNHQASSKQAHHYHFHRHHHHVPDKTATSKSSDNQRKLASTSWSHHPTLSTTNPIFASTMPGTFTYLDNKKTSKDTNNTIQVKKSSFITGSKSTTGLRFHTIHTWITTLAFIAHLFLLWLRP